MTDRSDGSLEMEPWIVIDTNEAKMPDTAKVSDAKGVQRFEEATGLKGTEATDVLARGYGQDASRREDKPVDEDSRAARWAAAKQPQ